MQALIFCGIQASGKSSYYKQYFFNSHVRISMDLLRTRHRERAFLALCIRTQARFVVDNTNPTALERQYYIRAARAAGYQIIGYHFRSELHTALQRNALRPGREKIPEVGIRATRNKFEAPSFSEGFDRIFLVQALEKERFHLEEISPTP